MNNDHIYNFFFFFFGTLFAYCRSQLKLQYSCVIKADGSEQRTKEFFILYEWDRSLHWSLCKANPTHSTLQCSAYGFFSRFYFFSFKSFSHQTTRPPEYLHAHTSVPTNLTILLILNILFFGLSLLFTASIFSDWANCIVCPYNNNRTRNIASSSPSDWENCCYSSRWNARRRFFFFWK